MNVVYLDQNIVIDLVDHHENDPLLRKARNIILELVNSGRAVFPYSDIHLSESAQMDFESQKRISEFWLHISKGYRFVEGKEIRSRQFLDLFHGRKFRFNSDQVLFQDQLTFIQAIESVDPIHKITRRERLREVVAYWATLKKENIDGRVRVAEATALAKLIQGMVNKILEGVFPSPNELYSDYNAIAADLAWAYHEQGYEDDALPRAIAFVQKNALKVPAIRVECVSLEALAEQYAADADSRSRRRVADSRLDHDSNDLAALSTFLPYCEAGISDGNAVGIMRRAYRKLSLNYPVLFTRREIERFIDFLEQMPLPEPRTDPIQEARRSLGKSLILVPWMRNQDELVRREELEQMDGIQRELLPFGGLKVWSSTDQDEWPILLQVLETTLEEQGKGVGNEAVLYGGIHSDARTQIVFETRIPFGMVYLAKAELEIAFKRNESQ